jgi:hypothetical protein
MGFKTSVVLAALCSLGLALFLLVLVRFFIPAASVEGYGVLSLDAAYSDREIGGLLVREGVENVISESTQWVFLDDFDTLRQIPLDVYNEQIESFDPRNDGYAERLRSFFVREGKRYFYIPLPPDFAGRGPGNFEKRLVRSLGDIPYSFSIIGAVRPYFRFFLLFLLAAAATVFFSRTPLPCAVLLPVLAPLLFAGPPGFALSAALAGLQAMLREPAREYFISRRYGYRRFLRGPSRYRDLWVRLGIFRRRGGAPLVFILAYGIICGIGGVSPVLGLAFFASFVGVFFLSLWAESCPGENPGHVRFIPVVILDFSVKRLFPPKIILPFSLASLLSLFVSPLLTAPSGLPAGEAVPLVSPAEYERHVLFQSSFSVSSPEDRAGEGRGNGYIRYILGKDGLVAAVPAVLEKGTGGELGEIPPFPLESLMAFLGNSVPAGETRRAPRDLLPPGLVLLTGIPLLFLSGQGNRKKKKIPVYRDKRIAA